MTRKRLLIAALISLVTAALVACGVTAAAPNQSATTPDALKGSWTLVWWSDSAALPDAPITMDIEDGRISGNSACNNYTGPLEANDSTFRTGLLAGTLMACIDDRGQAEDTYRLLLAAATGWSIEDSQLSLTTDGVAHLRFAKTS